jgi:catechol 2,3-dioxygenase-like lactoylglutathione lyase family enzyme
MEIHLGRLLDHVHLRVNDLDVSKAFYRSVLSALGRDIVFEHEHHFSSDELFVSKTDDDVSRVHIAFQASSEEQVRRFYEAALAAGGVNNGTPGERPYHPGYYAAYVLDPDGNNIEAVFHGAVPRSAPSVVVTI